MSHGAQGLPGAAHTQLLFPHLSPCNNFLFTGLPYWGCSHTALSLTCLPAVISFALSYLLACLGCGCMAVSPKYFFRSPCRGMLKTSTTTLADCEILWTSLRQGLLVIFGNNPLFAALVLIINSSMRYRDCVYLQSVLILLGQQSKKKEQM